MGAWMQKKIFFGLLDRFMARQPREGKAATIQKNEDDRE